jgi:hypothetical protein
MKTTIKYLMGIVLILIANYSCSDKDYSLGELTAPANLTIDTQIVGANTANPTGDGSGDVIITVKADNAISYKIDYDASTPLDLNFLSTGTVTKKYTNLGVNKYLITAVAYGKGGTSTVATKEVTVRSDFTVDPQIVANLTGGSSKTWMVDKSVPGHMGVGPWSSSSVTPEWWSAAINEKVSCCNCFYTARFTFSVNSATKSYKLDVATPDGAFTKTGALTTLPGIPGSGDEGCYSYTGGSSAFSFVPASSGVNSTAPSTLTSILLGGNSTFIGYGALQKEYEIMELNPNYMYLRVQGTETGNAWYIKLKPAN